MRSISRVIPFIFLCVLLACSSGEQTAKPQAPAKPEKKQAVLDTGREAFQRMYVAARQWAPDARPYSLESVVNDESDGQGGKASIWRSGFASASRRQIRAFLWSGSQLPDAPSPGITQGVEDTYNPTNISTQVFDFAFLKADTDKAYEVALKHGGEKLVKANPKQPVVYVLDWSGGENILMWHVVFGPNPHEAKLRIAVNASTGEFMRVER